MARTMRIGEFFIQKGIVDEATLERALEIQRKERQRVQGGAYRKLGDILVEDLGVDRHQVYRAISEFYGFKELEIDPASLSEEQIAFIRENLDQFPESQKEIFLSRKILPFSQDGHGRELLQIAAADPTDQAVADMALRLGYRRYEVFYTPSDVLEKVIEKVVPPKNEFLELIQEVSQQVEEIEEEPAEIDEEALDAEINRSLLGNLVEGCLVEAVRRGVSDIHIIPREDNRTEFHFREDGKLHLWHVQEGTRPEAIAAVVKDRAINVDRFERERAQDGFIQRRIDGHLIRFRVSILPIVGKEFERKFESIVIRVLDDRKVIKDLNKLGLFGKAKEDFMEAIHKPQGMVVLTGPTGSGKSTTIVAALCQVINPSVNVLTVEDPVEYIIEGARQIKINPEKLGFEAAVRSILRHDPDIVLVGEMRDLETAQTAIKLANTGHLTFSTLHTNDAPSVVSRLYKMGVEPFLIASAINLVVAQRLVRTLCPYCKRPMRDLDPAIPRKLGFTDEEIEQTTFYEPVGCDKCRGGYKGRVAIFEVMPFTKAIRRIILEAGETIDEEAIRQQAIKEGMLTLRAYGRERIKQGLTSLEEVAAVTMEI
ncbi:MAG: type II/IV secretion system protein [Candidatus Latescibacterota bacterium]|nr:MAG: type II/IV secretion system protein [Candidatus Latescibacterota bacterium]